MDKTAETLIDVSGFISEYSAHMMGCGVHTSRVIRSANRIGESFGYMVKSDVIQKRKNEIEKQVYQLVTHNNSSCVAWKHGSRTCPKCLIPSNFYKSFLIFKLTQCCNNSNFHYLCSRIGSE